jgi:hypothetical protein
MQTDSKCRIDPYNLDNGRTHTQQRRAIVHTENGCRTQKPQLVRLEKQGAKPHADQVFGGGFI